MGRRPVAMIAVGVLALTAGTCSSDDDSDSTSDRTTTTVSPETEVETAYLAFADMGARLLQAPDPGDPEIGERTTGTAMTEFIAGLRSLQDAGLEYQLGSEYSHDVRSVRLTGDNAALDVCVVDDSKQVNAATGEVTAEGATTVRWTVEMRRENGAWLVAKITEDDVQEGVTECI
jgi:hypothetical protein